MHVLDHMSEMSNSLKEISSALTTRNENELNNCNNLPFNAFWTVKIHKSPCELWGRFCSSNTPPSTLVTIKLTASDSQNKNMSSIKIFHSSIGCNVKSHTCSPSPRWVYKSSLPAVCTYTQQPFVAQCVCRHDNEDKITPGAWKVGQGCNQPCGQAITSIADRQTR